MRYMCAKYSDWSAMGRLPAKMGSDRHDSIKFNSVGIQ